MKNYIITVFLATLLISCSDPTDEIEKKSDDYFELAATPKIVESSDGVMKLTLNQLYIDQLPRSERLIAMRMPGVSKEELTLLQTEGESHSSDIVYALAVPIPKQLNFDFDQVVLDVQESMESHPQVYNFDLMLLDGRPNHVEYSAENKIADVAMYEYCHRAFIQQKSLLVCAASAKGMEGPKRIIQSLQFMDTEVEEGEKKQVLIKKDYSLNQDAIKEADKADDNQNNIDAEESEPKR